MYSAETLAHLNDIEDLKYYVSQHPLVELNDVDYVKHSPDYAQVDVDLLEKATGLKLVEDFFVDSSGFGSANEPALPYQTFIQRLVELIEKKEQEGKTLYSCLTGIGQFQVYVSILEN